MKIPEWIKTLIFFAVLGIVLILLRQYVFTPVIVKGHSMDPTLQDGERVIALKNTEVKRFDIITFPAPDEPNKNYIKRVIGLPGETVAYANDQLTIDGKPYDEPYLAKYKTKLTDGFPLTLGVDQQTSFTFEKVPAGKLLVLGDNRRISKDSRMIGFIDQKAILGDVKFVFWPLNRFGVVKE